jgi:hypothetical protein
MLSGGEASLRRLEQEILRGACPEGTKGRWPEFILSIEGLKMTNHNALSE